MSVDENAVAYMTEVPVPDLNLVYVKQAPESFVDTLNKSKKFFASKNLGFVVIIPDELCSSKFDNILIDNGYCKSGRSVAMLCDVNNIKDITESLLPHELLLIDDTKNNTLGAQDCGWHVYHYQNDTCGLIDFLKNMR